VSDIEIKVDGLEDVKRNLYRFGTKFGDKIVYKSLRLGARVIVDDIKRRVPVRTGVLRKGIIIKRSKIHSKRRGTKRGLYITIRRGPKAGERDAYYGRFQNDGWNVRGKLRPFGRKGKERKTLPGKRDILPKSFMQKGFSSSRTYAIRVTIKAARSAANILAKKSGFR